MRTIPDIQTFLQPLEDVIHQHFIPALFGRPPCSSVERDLFALPVRFGGLGLVNPCKVSQSNFHDSEQLTSPLVALIIAQCINQTADLDQVHQLKLAIRKTNRDHQAQLADTLMVSFPPLSNAVLTLLKNLGHPPG